MIMDNTIDYHLQEALSHLEMALHKSVSTITENEGAKKQVGHKWEEFLSKFFHSVRENGKKSRINLLGLFTFPRFR
jgi:hypothetical protein